MEYLVYIMGLIAGSSFGVFVALLLLEFKWVALSLFIVSSVIGAAAFVWWVLSNMRWG